MSKRHGELTMCLCVECAETDYKIQRYRQLVQGFDALTRSRVADLINELQKQIGHCNPPASRAFKQTDQQVTS